MVIETKLSKDQFVRLAILRHFQRSTFYIYASMCAIVTAYALLQGPPVLLLAAWVPFLMYILFGIVGAIQASRVKDSPVFLPTRYDFHAQGVTIRTARGESRLTWKDITGWRKMVDCYVLVLNGGAILAIPEDAVPNHQREPLEKTLTEHIKRQQRAARAS